MDAQNAAEAASTKPAASSSSTSLSSSRPAPESDRVKGTSSTLAKSLANGRQSSSLPKDTKLSKSPSLLHSQLQASKDSRDARDRDARDARDAPKNSTIVSSASSLRIDRHSTSSRDRPDRPERQDKPDDDKASTDGNSEAETIVLSKDGSPAKPRNRKVIKHEDKRNGDASASSTARDEPLPASRKHILDRKESHSAKVDKVSVSSGNAAPGDAVGEGLSASALALKKKRLQDKQNQMSQTSQNNQNNHAGQNSHSNHVNHASNHASHHPSSGAIGAKRSGASLNSVPVSPPRSRQHSTNPHSGSDSERRPVRSPTRLSSMSRDRIRPSEKLVPNKRKAPKDESDDEADFRKARRQRLATANADGDSHGNKLARMSSQHSLHGSSAGNSAAKPSVSRLSKEPSRNRSSSPQPKIHRRSLSTQLPSQSNGLGLKKKRIPAPLQSMDYHSDESSASVSPHLHSSKPRNLATPATADSNISPAKIGPHKKHLDAHGQTFLARACARGEYDLAKQRLVERPEDLNVADFAGNTPLQIAALNGYGEIVKLLIDAGCNIDCVNYDKDTPLLDAVDNGHLGVVKLLLEAGVSPRKANVNGEEPLDRVSDNIDNATEIRAALVNAKKREGDRRHTSEEHRQEHEDSRLHGPDSPRRSPAPGLHSAASGRRAGNARATKTSNHLLYMPMDDKTLRQAAGRGDEETVTRILQVREAFDDPESMVAAARGGHEIVMQLLLALGSANPDPDPIASMPKEYGTPMLAAIGQENLNVVSLLLEQSSFDPTRRRYGKTYHEIARQRAGPNWKEEEELLKKAYDAYKKGHDSKDSKLRSPSRKDPELKRTSRLDQNEEAASRSHKRKLSSPSAERVKKPIGTKTAGTIRASTSPREERTTAPPKKSDQSSALQADTRTSPKRTSSTLLPSNKHKRDDRSSVASAPDRDTPPPAMKQVAKSKKADSDLTVLSSDGETVKPPRRKLISGKELKDEKEKQRRASLASTSAGTSTKEVSSPHEPRHDDMTSDKARVEKHRDRDRDRARQLKNEETRDSIGVAGDSSSKRHRLSETPPRIASTDKDASEAPIKKRKLDGDSTSSSGGKERRASDKSISSSSSRDTTTSRAISKRRDDEDRKTTSTLLKTKRREASLDRSKKTLSKSVPTTEKSIHVKSEDVDVEMTDVSAPARPLATSDGMTTDGEAPTQRVKEESRKAAAAAAQAEAQVAEAAKKEEEAKRVRLEEEKKRKKEEEEARRREEEERKRKAEEEEEQKRKAEEEDRKRKRQEEEDRRRKDEERKRKEEERKRREEEEEQKKQEEELERKRREEERKRKEEEEERRRKKREEEEKRRAEEERLRKERLEKEAAEEARRKREEEERKVRERQEREERERQERERIRAEREAREAREAEERRRQREEEERTRIAQLPPVMQWLSTCANPRMASIVHKFHEMQGVRYDCIVPSATGTEAGREQWVMNTQVALILGDKDFSLSKYTAWERLPVSKIAKRVIWRVESDRYSLTDTKFFELGKALPDYYGGADPDTLRYQRIEQLRNDAWAKFLATDMFFVKASEVMKVVPNYPHLLDARLILTYRELPETEAELSSFRVTQKWKNDPGAGFFGVFAPRYKYYVNGKLVGEEKPGYSAVSKTPFPDVRVPRRNYVAVLPGDPDYLKICEEQGIDPASILSAATTRPASANGTVDSLALAHAKMNGKATPTPVVNGDGLGAGRSVSLSVAPLANGFHGPYEANGINGVNGTTTNGTTVNGTDVNGIHATNGTSEMNGVN